MFCPQCGRESQPEATFCMHCGAALGAGLTRPPVAHPPPPFEATGPAASAPAMASAPAVASAPAAVRYGGFWRRFVAWWIDAILLGLAAAILQVSMGVDLFENDFTPQLLFSNFISFVIGWLYCALLESGPRQATLGQMVIGIQVTDLAHRRISFARASGRHFAQVISVVILCVGYIMIAFTEKKQGLHDMMAGCLVVRAAQ